MKSRCVSFALCCCLAIGGESIASAQAPPAPPPAPPPAAAPPAAPPAAATPPAPPPPAAPPPAAPPPAAPPPPAPAAAAPPPADAAAAAAAPAAPAAPPPPKWYDVIAVDAFVDAYASFNYNLPKPQTLTQGLGGNQYRAFDVTNGFAINWVGLNAAVAPDPVGGQISLRIGPGARIYAGNDNQYGLEIVKQAYATWKPGGKDGTFTIDFGKYDEPYGSEVAETQYNMNYSRSALFNYTQPLFFTGLRLDWAPASIIDLKLILANGWNNSVSQNAGKTIGIQANIKPSDTSLISVGYAVGPQEADTAVNAGVATGTGTGSWTELKHLVDLIVDVTVADKLRFLLNGDFVAQKTGDGATHKWGGANLGIHYAATDNFGIALRGEFLDDPEGFGIFGTTTHTGTKLIDGTLTLDAKVTSSLLFKLEQRFDHLSDDAGEELFQKKTDQTSKSQMTTMLGIVWKTN